MARRIPLKTDIAGAIVFVPQRFKRQLTTAPETSCPLSREQLTIAMATSSIGESPDTGPFVQPAVSGPIISIGDSPDAGSETQIATIGTTVTDV